MTLKIPQTPETPKTYLVSDRRRLFSPAETFSEPEARTRLIRLAQRAREDGIDFIQLREKDLSARAVFELAREMVAVLTGSTTRLLINDRLDTALAAGAAGVHLTTRSLSPEIARRTVPPGFLIGTSTHTAEELAAAAGFADFAVCGPVFETPGKTAIGLERFAELVRDARLPVFALGGITKENTPLVLAAGAAGIAGIRLFSGSGQ